MCLDCCKLVKYIKPLCKRKIEANISNVAPDIASRRKLLALHFDTMLFQYLYLLLAYLMHIKHVSRVLYLFGIHVDSLLTILNHGEMISMYTICTILTRPCQAQGVAHDLEELERETIYKRDMPWTVHMVQAKV